MGISTCTRSGKASGSGAEAFTPRLETSFAGGWSGVGKNFTPDKFTVTVVGRARSALWLGADGALTDNIALGLGMYTTFEFVEDAPGSWPVHCHVPSHLEGGMVARYIVE